MSNLWSKNGGPPMPLPFKDTLEDGTILTDLANQPASQALLGWVEIPDTGALPDEIPMHRARKALRLLGPAGEVFDQDDPSWFELVEAAIAAVPDKRLRGQLRDDLDTAPNLVLAGESTQMIKTAIGMSDEQLEAVARLALTLP